MSRRCDLLSTGVMSGNQVSHSNRKTRRRFLPNLKSIALHSNVLGVDINLKVSAATLRTINKYGNIDAFLINYRYAELSSIGRSYRKTIQDKLIAENKLQREKKGFFHGPSVLGEAVASSMTNSLLSAVRFGYITAANSTNQLANIQSMRPENISAFRTEPLYISNQFPTVVSKYRKFRHNK